MTAKRQAKELNAASGSIGKKTRGNSLIHYKGAKFHTGQLVYNGSTKEDGFVSSVWADDGVITYEIWVPKNPNSWDAGHWISHWLESLVAPSANKHLGSPLPN
jgi:hypothetical protein